MLKSFFVAVLIWLVGTQPITAATGSARAPATLLKRVSPRYPAKAVERGDEGWVHLQFTITPEGTTSDIRVIASYPRSVFDRSAANAVAKWIYTPRRENDVPVPQPDNQAVLSFALAESISIREGLAATFATASRGIAAHNWDAAQKALEILGSTQGLHLYELAVLEHLRGQLAFGKDDYATAVASLTRALSITARFDVETRAAISQMLVTSAVNGRQFARAVEAFDAWNPPDVPQLRDLRRTIEAIRTARAIGKPDAEGIPKVPGH